MKNTNRRGPRRRTRISRRRSSIAAVWQALERFGLSAGAQILEPSMGVGHFFGLQPEALLPGAGGPASSLTASPPASRRRSTRMRGSSRKASRRLPLPDDFFDAVIGNIPFGNYPVHDPACRNRALTRAIHDYFLARSVDKVRPGGIVALITSRYTMDKHQADVRRHLARPGRSRGRDPAAEHGVQGERRHGSDHRHPVPAEAGRGSARAGARHGRAVASVETPDGEAFINEYFIAAPGDDAGRTAPGGHDVPGAGADARSAAGGLSPALLDQAVASLPAGIYRPREEPRGRAPPRNAEAPAERPRDAVETGDVDGVKEGAFARAGRAHRRAPRRRLRGRRAWALRPRPACAE